MKQILNILFICLILLSCKKDIQPDDVSLINGYWEIEKVVFNDGNDKLYTINESYDYFEINKRNKGLRKKVKPQLNGTFLVNNTYESIEVQSLESKFFIVYTTPYTKWKEEIVSISNDKLVLRNEQKSEYHYKKAEPVTVLNNGKKTK